MDLILIRLLFVTLLGCVAYFLRPFSLGGPAAVAVGVICAIGIVGFELRVREVSMKRLIGAAIGSILGILGAYLISLVLGEAMEGNNTTRPFLQILLLAWMTYCGLVLGAANGEMLNLAAFGALFGGENAKNSFKILDTSVIIDGRIADIAETGFIEGPVVIPQFVLRELQFVADSA